ncbi:MAG: enoyl-CoA hydratase-related protein [Myxococcota bacterium]|nr:enoyl-CoA hydratase-related protein [Myxococcota bacterium]
MSGGFEYLRLEQQGAVALLTLNRPPLNALNTALVHEIGGAVVEIGQMDGVRAVVVTGEGRAFVAGADIAQMQHLESSVAAEFAGVGQDIFSQIEALPMPVVAAVNGFALGGGCELAMACDIILASSSAVFGQPEVKLGVIPGFGGTQRLVRRVGIQRARELCYTGRTIKADEAVEMGLALRVVEGDVVEAAIALAEQIGANSPTAVSACKHIFNECREIRASEGMLLERSLFGACFETEDQTEGMSAFLEKRPAKFPGR